MTWKNITTKPFRLLIRLYQKTISFDHGILRVFYPHGFCRYYPSCSEYANQALEKKGLLRGSYLSVKRVFRCNPLAKGGHDEIK